MDAALLVPSKTVSLALGLPLNALQLVEIVKEQEVSIAMMAQMTGWDAV